MKDFHGPFYDAVRNADYIAHNVKIDGRGHGRHRHDIPKPSWRKRGTSHKILLKINNDPAETIIRRVSNRGPEFDRYISLLGESLGGGELHIMHIIVNQHPWFMPIGQFVACFVNQSDASLVSWTMNQ